MVQAIAPSLPNNAVLAPVEKQWNNIIAKE